MEDIVRIDGTPEYVSLMHRLSGSAMEAPEVYPSWMVSWMAVKGFFGHTRRRINRLIGRPATQDIGILAAMIAELKEHVEAELKTSIHSTVIATTNLFGFDIQARNQFQQQLEEASVYGGLKFIQSPFWLGAPAAAAASQGWGMCDKYTDKYACEVEEESMPLEMVLAVEYTKRALTVALSPLRWATSSSDDFTKISYTAGSNHDDADGHWGLVRELIEELPRKDRQPVSKVLVMGESAEDERFLDILRATLGPPLTWNDLSDLTVLRYSPLYTAARGAAEFAKRIQETPRGCIECKKCRERRRKLNEDFASRRVEDRQDPGKEL